MLSLAKMARSLNLHDHLGCQFQVLERFGIAVGLSRYSLTLRLEQVVPRGSPSAEHREMWGALPVSFLVIAITLEDPIIVALVPSVAALSTSYYNVKI